MTFTSSNARERVKRRKAQFHNRSLNYILLQEQHHYIPLNMMLLRQASKRVNQELVLGEVVIYNKVRPVKIIAGFTRNIVIVQFLDRIDTPIARVSSFKLWSGREYDPNLTDVKFDDDDLNEMFSEEPENTNAFEDGWW